MAIQTTLYDLLAALSAEVGPDEEAVLTAVVVHLLQTQRVTCTGDGAHYRLVWDGGEGTGQAAQRDAAQSLALEQQYPRRGARHPQHGDIRMARGRKTALTITLTGEDRQALMAWQRSTTIKAGRARRGRIILQLADGVPISDIARTVGISRRFVYKWVRRFLQEGLEGLADKPGRGSRRAARQNEPR
jgi:hypothetical protein